jgi:fluoroquinolone transport system permease protein
MTANAARLRALVSTDFKLQLRHGFYAAYAVVTLIYALGVGELAKIAEEPVLRAVAATLIYTDPSTLGAFFVGGLVLLEKQSGSLTAVFATPVRPGEYLLSKAVSLTALALATSLVVALATGLPLRPLPLLVSVSATSVLFVLLGLAVAARVRTVNGYMLAVIPVAVVPMLPALRFLGVETGLLWLIPTQASIRLLEAALDGAALGGWEIAYAVAVLPVACGAAAYWARGRFVRYLLGGGDGGAPRGAPARGARCEDPPAPERGRKGGR